MILATIAALSDDPLVNLPLAAARRSAQQGIVVTDVSYTMSGDTIGTGIPSRKAQRRMMLDNALSITQ